jgi:hypothetical protein
MTPSDTAHPEGETTREIAENIRFFAQDLLDNGHLFGAQIGGVMAIRDEADKLLSPPSRPQGEEGLDRDELTDLISDAISDGMEMDWQARDGARAVVAALIKENIVRVAS